MLPRFAFAFLAFALFALAVPGIAAEANLFLTTGVHEQISGGLAEGRDRLTTTLGDVAANVPSPCESRASRYQSRSAEIFSYVGHWQKTCGPNGCQSRYVEDAAPRPVLKANYPCKCAPGYCTCRAGECGDGKCPTAAAVAPRAPAARTAACASCGQGRVRLFGRRR